MFMLDNIQKLFTELSKLNFITLWLVFLLIIVFMVFVVFFFSILFIVEMVTKPITWLYKKVSNI